MYHKTFVDNMIKMLYRIAFISFSSEIEASESLMAQTNVTINLPHCCVVDRHHRVI